MATTNLIHRPDINDEVLPMSPSPISPALQAAVSTFAGASGPLMTLLVHHLAGTNLEAVEKMSDASLAGHRLMLAIDVDTPDAQVRLVSIDPEQRVTQIAAIGQFPPTETRN